MKLRGFAWILAATVGLTASSATAETYEVRAKRKSSNAYELDGGKALALTRYCYVYAYHEEAILKLDFGSGHIVFIDSGEKCDVKKVYVPADLKNGNYRFQVTREDDDVYEALTGEMILTRFCYEYEYFEDAIVRWNGSSGKLIFPDSGKSCDVEKVMVAIR